MLCKFHIHQEIKFDLSFYTFYTLDNKQKVFLKKNCLTTKQKFFVPST